MFDVAFQGFALHHRLLVTLTVSTSEDCFESCRATKGCKSVNYKVSGESNCQLNTHTKENVAPVDFKNRDGWTYYATNYNKKNVCL